MPRHWLFRSARTQPPERPPALAPACPFCLHVRTHKPSHIHTRNHARTHERARAHTHTHIHTYTHTHILTYSHMHTHTCIHSHTHTHRYGKQERRAEWDCKVRASRRHFSVCFVLSLIRMLPGFIRSRNLVYTYISVCVCVCVCECVCVCVRARACVKRVYSK